MYVYVVNQYGEPLMPCRPRKARKLIESGKAVVLKRTPFTIQLLFGSSGYKQEISLGVDAGSKNVGICATTEKKVLYKEELHPRNDVVGLLSDRREARRTRRSRLRHRPARFNNRVRSKNKGWLTPSVEVKIQEHISAIKRVMAILPVTSVTVETAEFDTQRLKALEQGTPLPVGTDYRLGEMHDTYNTRQYVLKRDEYTCQCCGKHGDGIKLHVHHKESRKTGGNAPNNLITLCEDCHKAVHLGTKTLPEKKGRRSKSLRDAAFMGIMRKTLYEQLQDELDIPVYETKGYITKMYRELYKIEKSHTNDALVISGNFLAVDDDTLYYTKCVRHHNRQIHKKKMLPGGIRKRNQAEHVVRGYRLFDTVKYNGELYFVFGRRASGFFDIRKLDGTKANNGSVSNKRLRYIQSNTSVLVERIKANSSRPS